MADGRSLPSRNDSAAKSAILDLVARVTTQGRTDFVPPAGRIATFDNDGTLWSEQPSSFSPLTASSSSVGDQAASGWLATARHPKFGRLFEECAPFRPALTLIVTWRAIAAASH
jgi:hypothetical protein